VAGARASVIQTRKTAPCRRGKERVSEAERKLVVRIPPVVRLGPILVQPQTVIVAFQVEDVRVAIPVSDVWRAIRTTARASKLQAVFYL
jgi:hypothetical protein